MFGFGGMMIALQGFLPYGAGVTMNPSDKGANITLSNGNLDVSSSSGGAWQTVRATEGRSGGRWYWEVTVTAFSAIFSGEIGIGAGDATFSLSSFLGDNPISWGMFNAVNSTDGVTKVYTGAVSLGVNDVLMVALDLDAGKCWIGENGTWLNSGNPTIGTGEWVSDIPAGTYFPGISIWSSAQAVSVNFGATPFVYAAP